MRKTPILSLGRTASGSPPRHQHPLHQPEKTDFAISRPIVITSPMDGSPQSGSFPRNHPMALRCRRVGAVHSIIRVTSTSRGRPRNVSFTPNATELARRNETLLMFVPSRYRNGKFVRSGTLKPFSALLI